jgi:hypothetical protein
LGKAREHCSISSGTNLAFRRTAKGRAMKTHAEL